ncbi:MAG: hypothetical protein HQK49_18975 [Oligoflexia bacterium]|nr:hypothetical protein [Oligoflexia bacterium]
MNNKGLSLIEILIAATILAFVSFGIVQITDNSFKTKDRIIGEDREFLQVETAMSRLQEDIVQIYSPLYFAVKAPPAPLEIEAFSRYEGSANFSSTTTLGHPIPIYQNPDKSTFEFFTFSNRRRSEGVKQSTYAWVKYSLRSKEARSSVGSNSNNSNNEIANKSSKVLYDLVRSYTPDDPFSLEKRDWEKLKVKQFVLLPNVASFEFSFWDEVKKKFVENLNELSKDYVIRAVKVKFTWVGKGAVEYNDERIFKSIWPYLKLKKATAASENKNKNTTSGPDGMGGMGAPGTDGSNTNMSGGSSASASSSAAKTDDSEESD